jgi:hypothetical protein
MGGPVAGGSQGAAGRRLLGLVSVLLVACHPVTTTEGKVQGGQLGALEDAFSLVPLDDEFADLSPDTGDPNGLRRLGDTALSSPADNEHSQLYINGNDDAAQFPMLTLDTLTKEVQTDKLADATFKESQHVKTTSNMAQFAADSQVAYDQNEAGKRLLRVLHNRVKQKKRYWEGSRHDEKGLSTQLKGILDTRASEYVLFQIRCKENVEAVALFLEAGRLICDYLRGIRDSVDCRGLFAEPMITEPPAPSIDQDQDDVDTNKRHRQTDADAMGCDGNRQLSVMSRC